MSDAAFREAIADLRHGPALFGRPETDMTACEEQFWVVVHKIVARALQSTISAWIPWTPANTRALHPDIRTLTKGSSTLCLVLARDLLPELNLEPHDIFEQLLFIAEAFGLIAAQRGAGPQFIASNDSPSLTQCSYIASLALEGQLPHAAIDRWYTLLGGRCPRCERHALGRRPATSRTGTDQICTPCAHDEALRGPEAPGRDQWPVPIIHLLPSFTQAARMPS